MAISMMERLEQEMRHYAELQNHGKIAKLKLLLDQDIEAYARKDPDAMPFLSEVISHVQQMIEELLSLRDKDATYINNAIPYVVNRANDVPLPPAEQITPSKIDDMEIEAKEKGKDKDHRSIEDIAAQYCFVLQRYCGQETHICK